MDREIVCDEFQGIGNVWRDDARIIKGVPYRVVVTQAMAISSRAG